MTLVFAVQARGLERWGGDSSSPYRDVTLSFTSTEEMEKERIPITRSDTSLPGVCEKKVCRIRVNGFSGSGYVYGQVEFNPGNKQVKGFIYKPGKQVYVYGQQVTGQSFLFLLKDAKGRLYRLSPVENGQSQRAD